MSTPRQGEAHDAAESALTEARAEVERLRVQRDKANSRTLRMWERATSAESALTEARAENERLRAEVERLRGRLDRARHSARRDGLRASSAESALTEAREQLSRLREAVEGLADEWAREDAAYWHFIHEPDVERAIEAAKFAVVSDLRAVLADVTPAVQGDTGDAPPAEWDRRGGSMWLNREEWGVIIDALIQHRAHADHRKAVNSESTSDVRSDLCADLIGRINAAAAGDDPAGQEAAEAVCAFNVGTPDVCRCVLPRGHAGLHQCTHTAAPFGSDEQGDRPATADANGVHDTKGGAAGE